MLIDDLLVRADTALSQLMPPGSTRLVTAIDPQLVGADLKLTTWGCGGKVGLIYVVSPRLSLYSEGLSDPREILIRFSLYQWIYESTI